jgi:excisionase family DNA binding protein
MAYKNIDGYVRITETSVETSLMLDDQLFTVDEVANQLRVSKKTILRWINAGILVAIKLEKEYRIAQSDLEDFKRRRRTDQRRRADDKD